jgi:hypothetical protein
LRDLARVETESAQVSKLSSTDLPPADGPPSKML